MDKLEVLAQKLGISLNELKERIKKNKDAEEDIIKSNAKKKHKQKRLISVTTSYLVSAVAFCLNYFKKI